MSTHEVVVTGASGFIGRRVVEKLLSGGWDVTALSREPDAARSRSPHDVAWLRLGSSEADAAVRRIGRAINLAGQSGFDRRWNAAYKERIRDSRVDVTTWLSEGIAASSARERVLVSASGVPIYGDCGADVVDEDHPLATGSFLADATRAWEEATGIAADAGARVALVRIGVALGEGAPAMRPNERMFRAYAGFRLASGAQYFPWIHVDDLAALFVTALEQDRYRGVVHGVAPTAITSDEFADALGAMLRRPVWWRIPAWLLRLMVGEASQLILTSCRARPTRALQEGFRFRHPTIAGALAAIYAAQPLEPSPRPPSPPS